MAEIVVIGNCQAAQITTALRLLDPASRFSFVRINSPRLATINPNKFIFLQNGHTGLRERFPDSVLYPAITFPGFHPDAVHLRTRSVKSGSGGHWHSALALAGFRSGLSVKETLALFREEVFEAVGYFQTWDLGRRWLLDAAATTDVPLEQLFFDWRSDGCFMHFPNHPNVRVTADLAVALARVVGLQKRNIRPETFMADRLKMFGGWPLFPEFAERLGLPAGDVYFRRLSGFRADEDVMALTESVQVLDLEEFIAASFASYAKADPALLACDRLSDGTFERAMTEAAPRAPRNHIAVGSNPYVGLPDRQFWRRAIARVPAKDVDPVSDPKFEISRTDRVAAAGSCFAQHISAELVSQGANYFVAEGAPNGMSREEGTARNYGVYSARFGNLYTVRQAVQLFDRAFGYFRPEEPEWLRADGRFVDPFRPQIEPTGFANREDLLEDRRRHLAAVAEMFSELDVFVFTLGLTETWRSRTTGAVYPIAPGVAGGAMDESLHQFVNFDTAETIRDLYGLVERLKSVNSNCRAILTVSPVSLMASYEPRHVLTSTVASKAALRAAADQVSRLADVDYFPSFEIITGNYNRGAYFSDDCREVLPAGVAHVMRVFSRHYLGPTNIRTLDSARRVETAERTSRDIASAAKIICDEELLDAS